MKTIQKHVSYWYFINYLSYDYFTHLRGVEYCDEYVSLSVHLYISKTTQPIFTKFLCMLPVAMAQYFSDDGAICFCSAYYNAV